MVSTRRIAKKALDRMARRRCCIVSAEPVMRNRADPAPPVEFASSARIGQGEDELISERQTKIALWPDPDDRP